MDTLFNAEGGDDEMALENSKNTKKIVDAAIELFREKGYHEVTVSDICHRADLNRSSFYAVFSSKLEIISHVTDSVKDDIASNSMDKLFMADNDFERMWTLCDCYMQSALRFGPELMGSLFSLELEKKIDLFEGVHSVDDWYAKLIRNCQKDGIIRNTGDPDVLAKIGVDIELQVTYIWCKEKGAFSLQERGRIYAENFYDIAPEYRAAWAKDKWK